MKTPMENDSLYRRVKRVLLGAPRDLFDPKIFHNVSLIAFFAWVGLGADGISSSSYGPEEAYLALGSYSVLAIFVAVMTVVTIFIISGSYAQIIEAFPSGGGGYIVVSKLLGEKAGVVTGSALVIDYALTITVSVAAGADAISSFLPAAWLPYKFEFIALVLGFLIWINLRGARETVMVLTPIFLAFLLTHIPLILYAVFRHVGDLPVVAARVTGDLSAASRDIGWVGVGALLLRAYSMGAGTYTGMEAVSNSMQTLREPRVHTGKRAMLYLSCTLGFMAGGILLGYVLNGVAPVPGKTLNAVLFGGLVDSLWEGSAAKYLTAFVLLTEAVLLFVAAQTGFLGGPQVLSNMAGDSYMPHRFAHLSERLVTKYGVYFMGGVAFFMLIITGGSVRLLVIIYSINVFLTFSMSQFSMVVHWWKDRKSVEGWKHGLAINGIGFCLTASILFFIVIMKFLEGGWITLLVTSTFVAASFFVRSHYRKAAHHLRRLDDLLLNLPSPTTATAQEPIAQRQAPTAAILVSGYNGLGMHVFFSIIRSFPGTFRNFVFLSVGVIDTSRFKGVAEIENLSEDLRGQLANYVEFVKGHGYFAEAHFRVGTDVIEVLQGMATEVAADFPNVVFFAGQLVFQEENFFNKLLHNQTAFLAQKKLVFSGHPMIVMPIRVLE
ncbi:MAG: amino acid transporter [Deltaproteobacteria bacterium CG_4_9_14_3_um_filter_65_9]|nr:MAG: amino acid transporter [Deltaproteobacteria bacterium CG_4_9_14_3_um_filter_65_9]